MAFRHIAAQTIRDAQSTGCVRYVRQFNASSLIRLGTARAGLSGHLFPI